MKTAQEGRARGLNQSDREGVVCGGVARRGGKQIRGVAGVGGSVCVARRGCRSASLTSTPSAVTLPPTPHPHPAHSCDLSPPGTALAPSLFLRTKVRVCSSGGSSLQTLRVVLRRSFRSLVEQHAYLAYFQIFQRFSQFASALAAAVSLVVCGRAVALWPCCVRRPYSGGHVAGIAKCGCDV